MLPSFSPTVNWLGGFIADLPTPFDDRDRLDVAALARLCERQIAAGASAVIVGETAGEASTLTTCDHDHLVRAAVDIAAGRIRIIAGAGSNSTSQAVELTRRAQLAGADAVMSVVPYYNKPIQAGIKAHFRAIAGSTTLPVILHDNPGRCVSAMTDATVIRLAQFPGIIGLRDTTGDITRPQRLRHALPAGFRMLGGDDATALAILIQGGDGCVSHLASICPDLCGEIADACRYGQSSYAASLMDRLSPLAELLARDDTSATLKYALSIHGLMAAHVRLPAVTLDEHARQALTMAVDGISVPWLVSRTA